MKKQNYEVEVLINGKPVKEYYRNGKTYIEGRQSNEFSLRIKNNGMKRIVAIPSVDGLSVMDGKEASDNSSGYIINGYSSLTIDGWRVSDEEINKFFFASPDDSYAERTGKGDNLGVIGLMVFREKEVPPIVYSFCTCHQHNCWDCYGKHADSIVTLGNTGNVTTENNFFHVNTSSLSLDASANNSSAELGTGWGDSKQSAVTTVDFERENNSDAEFAIYYNTRQALESLGIDFKRQPQYVTPQAFPGKYCEPPK